MTLYEIVPTKLDINCPFAAGCKSSQIACISNNNAANDGYKIGGASCSTAYTNDELKALPRSSAGSPSYFAVNIGLEYPDRIEAMNHAALRDSTAAPDACFEWPGQVTYLLSWDPSVLTQVTAAGYTKGGTNGNYLDVEGNRYQFSSQGQGAAAYTDYMDTNHGWGSPVIADGTNYANVMRTIASASMVFSAGGAGCKYSVADDSAAYNWVDGQPKDGQGWFGMAHFGLSGGTCTYNNDGIDSDVDVWFGMHYFKVTGASKAGSLLRIEPDKGRTYVSWFHSNCTRAGGTGASDDDIGGTSWCVPCVNIGGNGPCNNTGNGATSFSTAAGSCPSTFTNQKYDPKYYVYGSEELPSYLLPGGPYTWRATYFGGLVAGPLGGGYQAWNRHVCVE